ncbi:MAG TPA: biosynthetic arginine decarboxylase, partial [Gemmatimonadales bacterium]|nr:biosynthetic arginine decarboxylase [Gemmatimonadales bacterium]
MRAAVKGGWHGSATGALPQSTTADRRPRGPNGGDHGRPLSRRATPRYDFPPRLEPEGAIAATTWSVKDAEKLYNMQGWGQGFFRVNPEGRVTVHPDGNPKRGLDLFQLALDLNAQGVGLPLLLRFSDILRARIETLATQFQHAIAEFGYEGSYTTVYPIKVNQQRHVVEEIVAFGTPFGVGLECGSKAELQAILGLSESTQPIIVCNGYKDEEYMRLALMGQKLGHRVFVVVEQLSEVDTFLKVAAGMGVEPTMGVRIKLATEGSGRWAKSGGERSKFGLSAAELMQLVDKLEAEGRKDALRLVHFHLGSQIPNIQYIKAGLEEIGRFYVELRNMGFGVTHVDVGGGLGVDYDGSRSTRQASVNYSIREYANDVVYTIGTMCRAEGVPTPNLIS